MFEQSMVVSGPASKRIWTTFMGMAGESVLVGAAVLVPLLWPEVLPKLQATVWVAPPSPPPPPSPAVRPRSAQPVVRRVLQVRSGQLFAPGAIPAKPLIIEDPPDIVGESGSSYGVVGGQGDVPTGGILPSIIRAASPAPAPPPHVEAPAAPAPVAAPVIQRLRVGGLVKEAIPVYKIDPAYPPLARTARVSGIVKLEGLIGTDGRIRELKVLSGHPLLVRAALEAVSKWIYKPTTLNGEPVEVIAPIVVTFVLN